MGLRQRKQCSPPDTSSRRAGVAARQRGSQTLTVLRWNEGVLRAVQEEHRRCGAMHVPHR